MRNILVLCLSTLLFVGAVIAPASADAEKFKFGATRTPIEGVDNWGWQGGPPANPRIWCPGGELVEPFDCSDSPWGRLHFRDGAGWSCTTSNDPRMTGVGLYTSNGNFNADSNGPVWGEFKIVPLVGCNKDAVYSEEYEDLVRDATSYWHGIWFGRRKFDSDKNAWVGKIKFLSEGVGGDLDGLRFRGRMWITTYTPFPMPYEYIFTPGSEPFDMPEAEFVGVIKE